MILRSFSEGKERRNDKTHTPSTVNEIGEIMPGISSSNNCAAQVWDFWQLSKAGLGRSITISCTREE